jgi:hypothetical protein
MIPAAALLVLPLALVAGGPETVSLPSRIHRIVLHTLGGPFYPDPKRRFRFGTPKETLLLWKERFGAHWIIWTDGSLWPRHPRPGQPRSVHPPVDRPLDEAWRRRLAAEARPVYSHVQGANEDTVGIELSHSGRSGDPFPEAQIKTAAWLVRALLDLSNGRLTPAAVVGHKDLDDRPAFEPDSCHDGCPCYADDAGRPYRRRVDPPEGLFEALAGQGLAIPRPPLGDAELRRSEAIPADRVPRLVR